MSVQLEYSGRGSELGTLVGSLVGGRRGTDSTGNSHHEL